MNKSKKVKETREQKRLRVSLIDTEEALMEWNDYLYKLFKEKRIIDKKLKEAKFFMSGILK